MPQNINNADIEDHNRNAVDCSFRIVAHFYLRTESPLHISRRDPRHHPVTLGWAGAGWRQLAALIQSSLSVPE